MQLTQIIYRSYDGDGSWTCADAAAQPCTRLVSIPRQALINTKSIRAAVPTTTLSKKKRTKEEAKLNSTQALSLHLCLARQRNDHGAIPDSYMGSLPGSFDEHPLTWLKRDLSESSAGARLFEAVPPAAKKVIRSVQKRYMDDWEVVQTSLVSRYSF